MPSDTATCSARSWAAASAARPSATYACSRVNATCSSRAELAPYLLDNLTSAGRAHLTLTRIAPSQADRPPQALQELRVTVSSPRLDSVIWPHSIWSRGSAADAVAAGRVNLNDLPCLKPDRAVQENDTVSVRGLGKLRVLALGGLTKKGRLALTLGKYL